MAEFQNQAIAGVSVHSLTRRLATLKLSANADWDAIFSARAFAAHRASENSQAEQFGICMAARLLNLRAAMPRAATRVNLALGVALVLLAIARYANDPRLGGNAGYRQLLATVQREADASDVLILNDDGQARYFFNANRARLKWYGLSRDPARWDAPTQQLVRRLGQAHARVWFAYDDAVDAPNSVREWMEQNWAPVQRMTFEDGVSLELYAPPSRP